MKHENRRFERISNPGSRTLGRMNPRLPAPGIRRHHQPEIPAVSEECHLRFGQSSMHDIDSTSYARISRPLCMPATTALQSATSRT